MDGNKDEALRCIDIAKSAITLGDKSRALKFIKIAKRLDGNLPVDDLLTACGTMNQRTNVSTEETSQENQGSELGQDSIPQENKPFSYSSNSNRGFSEQHVMLIRRIKRSKDFYEILGVEKTCSVEEIKKAYRRLSLKVHPDKNKAPGSDEAFKIVSKAFKCLSDDECRRQYDQTGLIEDFELNQQHQRMRRRRRSRHDFYDEDFDPDEIFRSFFFGSQTEMFHTANVYRTRGMAREQGRNNGGTGFNLMLLLQILPILVVFLLAYMPISEPEYTLQKTYAYQVPRVTAKHGIDFYVKSSGFDQDFPPGSLLRAKLEDYIVGEYKSILARYCHMELQRRGWNRNYPTPHCDKLHSFAEA